jgi:hypothetical protein
MRSEGVGGGEAGDDVTRNKPSMMRVTRDPTVVVKPETGNPKKLVTIMVRPSEAQRSSERFLNDGPP